MGILLAAPLAGALWAGGAASAPEVPFATLAKAPELWLGEVVRTVVEIGPPVDGDWDGYLSGLDALTHAAVDVWSDEQALWLKEEYESFAGRLYFARDGAAAPPPHTRVEVLARVGAYTAGRGWMEVLATAPTEEQLPEGSLLHAIRGLELLDKAAFELAAGELERALAAPLPAHHRKALEAAHESAVNRIPPPRPMPAPPRDAPGADLRRK